MSKLQTDTENQPPTMSCLKCVDFRSYLLIMLLRRSHLTLQCSLSPVEHSWELSNCWLVPVSTDNLRSPLALKKLTCSCEKEFLGNRCKHFKNKNMFSPKHVNALHARMTGMIAFTLN